MPPSLEAVPYEAGTIREESEDEESEAELSEGTRKREAKYQAKRERPLRAGSERTATPSDRVQKRGTKKGARKKKAGKPRGSRGDLR